MEREYDDFFFAHRNFLIYWKIVGKFSSFKTAAYLNEPDLDTREFLSKISYLHDIWQRSWNYTKSHYILYGETIMTKCIKVVLFEKTIKRKTFTLNRNCCKFWAQIIRKIFQMRRSIFLLFHLQCTFKAFNWMIRGGKGVE